VTVPAHILDAIHSRAALAIIVENKTPEEAERIAVAEVARELKMEAPPPPPPIPLADKVSRRIRADAEWVRAWLLAPVRLVTPRPPPDYVPPAAPPHTRRRRQADTIPPPEPADQPPTILGPLLYTSGDGVPRENINAEFENDPRFRRVAGFAVAADEATRNWPSQNR
jgi:hypothetical protein